MRFWKESHYLFRRQGSSQQPLWSSLSELLQEACLVPTQRGPQSICDPVALALLSGNSGQALAQNGVLEEERQEEEPPIPGSQRSLQGGLLEPTYTFLS